MRIFAKVPSVPAFNSNSLVSASSGDWSTIIMADFEEVVRAIPHYEDVSSVPWVVKKSFYLAVLAAAKREKKQARKARLIRENRCKR